MSGAKDHLMMLAALLGGILQAVCAFLLGMALVMALMPARPGLALVCLALTVISMPLAFVAFAFELCWIERVISRWRGEAIKENVVLRPDDDTLGP